MTSVLKGGLGGTYELGGAQVPQLVLMQVIGRRDKLGECR